jgi:hypothetical protein
MAKTISLLSVAPPTTISATLEAGGSLVVGRTYYYRFISVRSYQGILSFSEPSVELSATPTTGNQQVKLDWTYPTDAEYVILQRSTTSGNYPASSSTSLGNLGSGSFSPHNATYYNQGPYFVKTITTLTDKGTQVAGEVSFSAPNLDHSKGYPAIWAYSDANDTITLQDVYLADVAGGWGLIDKILPPTLKSNTSSTITLACPYVSSVSLYFTSCKLDIRGILIILQGTLFCNSTTTLLYGSTGMPCLFCLAPYFVPSTTNGTTYTVALPFYWNDLQGTSSSVINNYIRRSMLTSAIYNPYSTSVYDNGLAINGGTIKKSIIGLGAGNGMPIYNAVIDDVIFEGFRHYFSGEIKNSTVRYAGEGRSHRWVNHTTFINTRTTQCGYDTTAGHTRGALQIDSINEGRGQTDNQPYIGMAASFASSIGNTLVYGHSMTVYVKDINNTPIQGATITVMDKNGYSDIWEYVGLHNQGLSTTSTTINVIDGSLFNVNDILRMKQYAERVRVVSKATNTLTIERAVQNTIARNTTTGDSGVYRQLQSVITDVNGKYVIPTYITNRELACNRSDGGYFAGAWEDTLVAQNYAVRTYFTPHTITISKAGYQTQTIVQSIDKATTINVTLQKTKDVLLPVNGSTIINLDPTNVQNEDGYLVI